MNESDQPGGQEPVALSTVIDSNEPGPSVVERTDESGSIVAAPRPLRRLGRTAFIMALCVLGGSLLISILTGILGAPYAQRSATGFNFFFSVNSPNPLIAALGTAGLAQALLGTIFGTWALVQGIVATALNRQRPLAIAAIVIAFVAPGLSTVVLLLVMWASLPPLA